MTGHAGHSNNSCVATAPGRCFSRRRIVRTSGLVSGVKPSERAEPGPMSTDRGCHLVEPAGAVVVQARESCAFTRQCRRVTAQAKPRPSLHGASMLAMTRRCPPHWRQVSSGTSLCPSASRRPPAEQIGNPADLSMSTASTRSRRCAHDIARCRSLTDISPRAVEAAVRVPGAISARSGLASANKPW